jgi:AraC-like DNA-binding protein
MFDPDTTPTVATVMEPTARSRLDAAGEGCFAAVHTESVSELIQAVRERPVHAVLISPSYLPADAFPRLASLVEGFPGVPAVAVVSRHGPTESARLLALGASGVRRMVDLSGRDGWRRLRELVGHPASPTAAAVLARVLPALGSPSPGSRTFFEVLIRLAPGTTTVRALARRLEIRPSTLMSRFFRAELPSPKRYLSWTRIVHAAALFEVRGLSVADVAYRLEYSSPQSFGRHLRAVIGMTASQFRRRSTFAGTLEEYCDRLITPFRITFRTFQPFNHDGIADLGHRG